MWFHCCLVVFEKWTKGGTQCRRNVSVPGQKQVGNDNAGLRELGLTQPAVWISCLQSPFSHIKRSHTCIRVTDPWLILLSLLRLWRYLDAVHLSVNHPWLWNYSKEQILFRHVLNFLEHRTFFYKIETYTSAVFFWILCILQKSRCWLDTCLLLWETFPCLLYFPRLISFLSD